MIIPVILENSIEEINFKIDLVDDAAELIQIDVADGELVNGKTVLELDGIESTTDLELHLMVIYPMDFIDVAGEMFSSVVTQIEAENIDEFIEAARDYELKVGLSIMLETPLSELEPYLEQIDYVQFLAVNPGGQGRPFEHKVLEKIKEFKKENPDIPTQIDGGINENTLELAANLGVENFTVGSAIFKDENPLEKYKKLENLLENVLN